MVGEIKKGRYVYYHCTGNRGKCGEPYTPQKVLADAFAAILREFVIPRPVLDWLGDAVLESDRTERAARDQTVKQWRSRYDQIQSRIEMMYDDKLDGRISQEIFDKKAAEGRTQQEELLRKIQEIQSATPAPIDHAVDMLGLTSRASELFLEQPAREQRHLISVVVKAATWQNGALRTTLFEPFEILRHSNRESYRKENENPGSGRDLDVWLPESDTDPNTVLENRECFRFSGPLTKGKSSKMDFRRSWFSYQRSNCRPRIHQGAGRGEHDLGECHRTHRAM